MMDPADTEAPPVANFSINRLGHSVISKYVISLSSFFQKLYCVLKLEKNVNWGSCTDCIKRLKLLLFFKLFQT